MPMLWPKGQQRLASVHLRRRIDSIALGDAAALGLASIGIGSLSEASGDFSTAIGFFALAEEESAIAIGNFSVADGVNAVAIGHSVDRQTV